MESRGSKVIVIYFTMLLIALGGRLDTLRQHNNYMSELIHNTNTIGKESYTN